MKTAVIALLFAWSLNAVCASAQTAPVMLEINGQVNSPMRMTKEQLLALKRVDFIESRSVEQDGKSSVQAVRYQGILLKNLLEQTGLKLDRRVVRKAVILLTAQDGYQTSFSWGELFNSQLGDGVVVILRQNSDELLETDGFASLRSLQDIRPGPRHVRWLNKIEVVLPGEK